MVDKTVSFSERLGGRWAISLRAYIATAPPLILLGVVSEPDALTSFGLFAKWFNVSVLAYLALGLFLWLADRTYLRNRRVKPVSLWVVIGTHIIANEIRTITYVTFIHIFGLPDSVQFQARVLTAALMALTAFPLLTYALDSYERYTVERNRLIEIAINEKMQNLQEEQALDVLRVGIIKELQLRVSHSLDEAKGGLDRISDASALEHLGPDLVDIFTKISRGSIRKISHELRDEAEHINRFNWKEFITTLARSRPYRPLLVFPPLFALFLSVITRHESLLFGLTLAIVWGIPAVAITLAANWASQRFSKYAILIYVTSFGALVLIGLIPSLFISAMGRTSSEAVAWGLMSAIAGGTLIPLSGVGDGISMHRQSVLDALRKQVEQEDISKLAIQRETRTLTKQIASYMHGTVQASLSAAILRMSHALVTGDKEEAILAFNQARVALDLPGDFDFDVKEISITEHLANLQKNWAGLVEINFAIEGENLNALETSRLKIITTEAINNAVRHGEADQVKLSIKISPTSILFDSYDNGVLTSKDKKGMGLDTLDQFAHSDWKLTATAGGGAHLSARIPR